MFFIWEKLLLKRRIYMNILIKLWSLNHLPKTLLKFLYIFNLKYHNVNDFKFCIYKTGLIDSVFRKSAEMDSVNFLNIHKKRCINVVRSFNIKKLVFPKLKNTQLKITYYFIIYEEEIYSI